MAVPTDNFDFQNFYETTLNGDITDTTLVIPLATVPAPSEGILVINPDGATPEAIFYTSKGVNDVTCPSDGRGFDSTTAQPWSSGTTVIMAPVGYMFRMFKEGLVTYSTPMDEATYDYVASGCVWSGDSYGSTRAASMTSGAVYINGRRIAISSVTARSFTASRDTYIDVGTDGVLDYTEVTNNAASPALSADHIRLGIIVTGASNIANAGSVNQGQEDKVLPIASSVAYTTTDSLGNLICPRDPQRQILGFRRITTGFGTASTSATQATGLSCPVIVPTNRKIRITSFTDQLTTTASVNTSQMTLWDGTVGSGTQIARTNGFTNGGYCGGVAMAIVTPSTSSKTYNVGLNVVTSGTANIAASSTSPAYILVELV